MRNYLVEVGNLHLEIKGRLVASLISRIASYSVFPFIVLVLNDLNGSIYASIVMTINILLQPIFNFLGGIFSDYIGRKRVIMFSQISAFITYCLMLYFYISGINNLFVFSFLLNTCSVSTGSIAMDAAVLDMTTSKNRKLVLTIDYWIINFSGVIGLSLGSLFYGTKTFVLLSMLTLASCITCLMYGFILKNDKGKGFVKRETQIKFNINWILFLISYALIISGEYSLTYYTGLRLVESAEIFRFFSFHFDGVEVRAILQILNTFVVVLLTLPINYRIDRSRYTYFIKFFWGAIIYVVSYSLLAYSNNFILLIILMCFASISELIFTPAVQFIQSELIPRGKKGLYLSTVALAIQSSALLSNGEMVVGTLYGSIYVSLIILGLGVFGVLIGLFVIKKEITE